MLIAWIIILALLQVTVLRDLNLLLVLVILAGLRRGPVPALLMGASIGILVSIFSSSSMGFNLAFYSASGLLAGLISLRVYYKRNLYTDFLFSYCGVMLFYFILTGRFSPIIFSTAFCSAIFSPVLFRIIER